MGVLRVGSPNYTAAPQHPFPAMSHTTMMPLKPSTRNFTKCKSTGNAGKAHKRTKYGSKSNPSEEQGLEDLKIRQTAEISQGQLFDEDISPPMTQTQMTTAGASDEAESSDVEEIEDDANELSKCVT